MKQRVEDETYYSGELSGLNIDVCEEDEEYIKRVKEKLIHEPVRIQEIGKLRLGMTTDMGDLKEFVICQAGAMQPLVRVGGKQIWIGSCGTGMYYEGVEDCEKARQEIVDLYK